MGLWALQAELEKLAPVKVTKQTKDNLTERLKMLGDAMAKYVDFSTENDIPDNIVDAFVEKVVVSKDGFDWYLRYAPETALSCKVEGRKGNATVSFSPDTPFTSSLRRQL